MHETHLIENIFQYLEQEERVSRRRIKKIYISLSKFGSISEEHFWEHYREKCIGTKWEGVDLEVAKIPYGPELEITRLDFE